jgi:hypothetical protein
MAKLSGGVMSTTKKRAAYVQRAESALRHGTTPGPNGSLRCSCGGGHMLYSPDGYARHLKDLPMLHSFGGVYVDGPSDPWAEEQRQAEVESQLLVESTLPERDPNAVYIARPWLDQREPKEVYGGNCSAFFKD